MIRAFCGVEATRLSDRSVLSQSLKYVYIFNRPI